ncbi:MAG: nucleotidyltransferase substrate binding protein [Cyanobacteriota bacterium]
MDIRRIGSLTIRPEATATWIAMLDYRNLLSHTYNQAVFEQEFAAIHQRYLPAPAQTPPSRITMRQL